MAWSLAIPFSGVFALGAVVFFGVMLGVCFVLSYRWFALGIGFGRFTFAAASPYHIAGSP